MPLYLSSIVRTELTSLWEEFHKEGMAYIMGIVHSHKDERKLAFWKKCNLRHFHISHNSPYSPRKKICITLVFLLGWVLQPSQEKLKTALMQNFGGQIRCIMGNVEVAYSTKRDFLVYIRHLHISHNTPCFCLPPNFSITLALFLLWVLQFPQEKLKTAYAKQGLSWKMWK